jgi:3-oxoacyl-[acyl-carrier protein] reductase
MLGTEDSYPYLMEDRMQIDLSGRTALVTGGTRGIGEAIARALVLAGATVVVHGRDEERVKLAARARGTPDRVYGIAADVGSQEGCRELADAVRDAVDVVDILVNNAAVLDAQDVMKVSAPDLERVLSVNAWSGLWLTQLFLPRMLESDNDGRIIWISSNAAVMPQPATCPYGMSKLLQLYLSRVVAMHAAGTTVTSNAVIVGPTETVGYEHSLRSGWAEAGGVWRTVLLDHPTSVLGRPILVSEVAGFVAILASPLSGAIRGAALRVDGGVIPTL